MLMTGSAATALPSSLPPVTGVSAPSVIQSSVETCHISQKDTTYTKIFVGGLPYHTTDKSLREHFEVYGEIEEAVVITDRQTGKSRGYGFVTMSDRAGADRATKDPNPAIDGRKANVNLAYIGAKPRGPTSSAAGYTTAISPAALRVYPHLSAGTPYGITAPTSYLGYQQVLQPASFPFMPAHHQLGHTQAAYSPADFTSAAAAYLGQYHAAAAAADPYASASAALGPAYSYGTSLQQLQTSVAGAAGGQIPLAYTAAPQAQIQEARLQ